MFHGSVVCNASRLLRLLLFTTIHYLFDREVFHRCNHCSSAFLRSLEYFEKLNDVYYKLSTINNY